MRIKEFIQLVKDELPHIQYVIKTLHSQGLSSGALSEIYGNLKNALNQLDEPWKEK